jgi:hypothetical protein
VTWKRACYTALHREIRLFFPANREWFAVQIRKEICMGGVNKVHLYVGITIVLVVAITGCCFLSAVNGILGRHRVLSGYAYGPRVFNWTPWTLASGLIGRLFGLAVAVIVLIAIVFLVLWITGRISVSWRKRGNRL